MAEVRIHVDGLPFWIETMTAAVDLLIAVELADPALIPDEVAAKAADLREVFERRAA